MEEVEDQKGKIRKRKWKIRRNSRQEGGEGGMEEMEERGATRGGAQEEKKRGRSHMRAKERRRGTDGGSPRGEELMQQGQKEKDGKVRRGKKQNKGKVCVGM